MELPFAIGDTYYLPICRPEQIEVLCPTCYGKKMVTLILGNGEMIDVQCQGCGLGHESPRGVITEYSHTPKVEEFVIASIESMHGGRWYVRSTTHSTTAFEELCTLYNTAMEVSQAHVVKQREQNMRNSEARTKHQRENETWTVAYHEKCMKDLERKMEWHRGKISARRKAV